MLSLFVRDCFELFIKTWNENVILYKNEFPLKKWAYQCTYHHGDIQIWDHKVSTVTTPQITSEVGVQNFIFIMFFKNINRKQLRFMHFLYKIKSSYLRQIGELYALNTGSFEMTLQWFSTTERETNANEHTPGNVSFSSQLI